PALGTDDPGSRWCPTQPGLASVGWRRRKRMALIGPWQWPDQGAFGRAAALATVRRAGGTPGGTVGRAATDIPRHPRCLELRQRKAPIRDEHLVGGQDRLGLLSQPSLQGGVSRRIRFRPHEETGDSQALAPYRANRGGEAQRDGREGLARLRTGMLG